MKYEIAWSDKHNCTNTKGHSFSPVSKEEKDEIIKEHPRFGYMMWAIWKCSNCGKITQSM